MPVLTEQQRNRLCATARAILDETNINPLRDSAHMDALVAQLEGQLKIAGHIDHDDFIDEVESDDIWDGDGLDLDRLDILVLTTHREAILQLTVQTGAIMVVKQWV